MPIWIANPVAFLLASLTGYYGHARYAFRNETEGRNFAKRWLAIQYSLNLTVCGILPLTLPVFFPNAVKIGILIFTPTALNAFIWSQAARFSALFRRPGPVPRIHADDLGLSHETNQAILQLSRKGYLTGTSLLVNGSAAEQGIKEWKVLEAENDGLHLCLHLCLTEGPATASQNLIKSLINSRGHLQISFGQWLLASLLPSGYPLHKRLKRALRHEIGSQLKLYQKMTGHREIFIDGHQHIHLVPMVLDVILEHSKTVNITWIRTTREPLPTGIPLSYWWDAWRRAGLLKWIILQVLSQIASIRIKRQKIATNSSFAGVIFTGQMTTVPLQAAWNILCKQPDLSKRETPPIILAHPSAPLNTDLTAEGFKLSHSFASSNYRQLERDALLNMIQHTQNP